MKKYVRRSKNKYVKRIRRFRSKRLIRTIKRIARSLPETKYVQQVIQSSLNHTNNPEVVFYPLVAGNTQGTGQNERIGNKISLTSIQLDCFWTVEFNPTNVFNTTGIQTTVVIQLWVVTQPRNQSAENTQDYINAWGANITNFSMPDPNFIKVLKMRRYCVPLTLTMRDIGISSQVAIWGGQMSGQFKYSRRKNKMQMAFETNVDTVPEDKNYWLILVTQGPTNLDGVTNFAGAYRYTYKDA